MQPGKRSAGSPQEGTHIQHVGFRELLASLNPFEQRSFPKKLVPALFADIDDLVSNCLVLASATPRATLSDDVFQSDKVLD